MYEKSCQSRFDARYWMLGLVHWDDPEGWNGEGGCKSDLLKVGRCPLQITKPQNKQFKKDHCEHIGRRRKSEESQPKGSICPAPHPNQGVDGNEEGADNNGATRGPSPHDTGYAQYTATQ